MTAPIADPAAAEAAAAAAAESAAQSGDAAAGSGEAAEGATGAPQAAAQSATESAKAADGTAAANGKALVKHLDPTQVELEISISAEELDAAQERAFRQLVRNVRIPGFRPGKAPRRIFEAAYGAELIHERAVESILPVAYNKALRENDLEPVEQPQFQLLPQEDGEPLRLLATVSIRPAIELKTYKGITVEGPPTTVPEDQVEKALQGLQREHATLIPVERPVKEGDAATLDYAGSIDGTPFEGGTAENQLTEIVEERFIPGFAAGIIGMSAGETKTVEAKFPDDYSNQELAGKTALFEVTVHDVKEPELPPLDDDFAKRFNPEGNLPGLRADIRRRLEYTVMGQVRRDVTGSLMDQILAAHEVPLPQVMVEREQAGLANEAKTYVERAGVSWEEYLAKQEKTEGELTESYRQEAERRVKATLLLEAIAKAEHIEATDKDIENEIATMARQYGQPASAVREMLKPNMGGLIDGVVRSKTVDFLLDNAHIVEAQAPAQTAGDEKETNAPAAQS